MCAPVTGYAIPARVGVWLVWCSFWGPLVLEGLSPRRAAAPPLRFWGVGIFRGPRPGAGTIRMRSPDRDLPNVP